ncbi:hypothetical protein BMS3Abin05_01101 [bacterium BMS3Abin05]|nr:hypothetical protein BMS3Abin05_01101 [bacterium BMS3Abin05]GBE28138.1 hypothetical protein BMS3Bbin03_02074 [bacterium BMS3Bbin03]HDL78793.1 SHOCT domain-containing protein [Bacteroidota bacterium]
MMHGFGWGGMWFGPVIGLLILGLILWLVISLLKNSRRQNQNNRISSDISLLDILKKRYARGKITKDEFEWMKRELM